MAVTSFTPDPTRIDQSIGGANDGFALTRSDTNYIEDPASTGKVKPTKGISFDINTDAISVVMENGSTRVIPAGLLAAGVIHPIHIVRVNNTGTGATVVVWGWF